MSGQAKVMVIPARALEAILRGEGKLINLPSDAQIVAVSHVGLGIGLRIHSKSYPFMAFGERLPLVRPIIAHARDENAA